ncbi:MAG TPA: TonB-dependent receptor [Thermoanaerobaculia bacterium]|jgi:hypothetical protein|nr:TonB-dependent receptor [Thermoanaerobaculia bacterium]
MSRVDSVRSRWVCAAFALLLLIAALPAAAQLQTGDLYGRTVNEQGEPLPGVMVTLTGTVGAPQTQTTDEKGQFRFLGLYPGQYRISAEAQGFSPLDYPNVGIRVGGKSDIEMTLTAALTESITIVDEAPLIDERKAFQGSTVGAQELDQVPTARDPWSLLSLAPGVVVDRFNVGGNESGQQSNFLGMGSDSRQNAFAVDGVILTDMNAVGGSATYFDFGAFEEVQFTVSSSDVSVATAGVTINQVTKRGTNDWVVNARYLRTDGELQSDPALPDGNRIDSVQEYGADVGGPLVKDHLWGWASYGESDIRNIVQGGQLDRTKLEDLNAKVNIQANSQLSGVLHYWTNDKLKFGRGAGPTRDPGTTHDQTTPQDIYKVEASYIPTSNWFFTGLWARDDGIFTLSPQAGLDGDRFRTEDGVLHGTNYAFTQDAIIDQARLDSNYFFNLGESSHELRFGGGFREQENHSGTVWPRGKYVVAGEINGVEGNVEQVVFPRNRSVGVKSSYDTAWAQDTFTAGRWTINAGLRYDLQKLENLPSSDPGNPIAQGLLPAINFTGNDAGGFEWETIVPRVSVTYALGKERTTLLRGTFSQYAEQLGQLPLASRVNPLGYSYAYFYFTDANGNLVLDPNEVGSLEFSYTYNIDPDNPAALLTPNVNDPDLKPYKTDELSLGLDHSFTPNFAGGVTVTYRNITDIPELRTFVVDDATGQTRLATRDDYVQTGVATGSLPNGGTGSTPIYNLRDGLSSTGGTFYTNGDREQDYLGVTLNFTRRMSNNWAARGHVTLSDWTWKIGPEFRRFDDPTDVVADDLGFSDGDDVFAEQSGGNKTNVLTGARWSFNLSGLYQVAPNRPWGFNFGASVNGREGYPNTPFVSRRGPTGSRPVQLTSDFDEFRHEDVIVVDAHLDKEFSVGPTALILSVDGFNLSNADYVLQRERNQGVTRANAINETLSPRVFRVGATFRFH